MNPCSSRSCRASTTGLRAGTCEDSMSHFFRRASLGLLAALAAMTGTARADDQAVEKLVGVLYEKGLIDESQKTEILAKDIANRSSASSAAPAAKFLANLELSGDFRLRYDSFYF